MARRLRKITLCHCSSRSNFFAVSSTSIVIHLRFIIPFSVQFNLLHVRPLRRAGLILVPLHVCAQKRTGYFRKNDQRERIEELLGRMALAAQKNERAANPAKPAHMSGARIPLHIVNLQARPMGHVQRVQRLYRASLRLSADWYWERAEQRQKALLIRELFEANRGVSNVKEADALCVTAEMLLAEFYHPQPFKYTSAPDGTKWERNIPFPEELLHKFVPHDNST